MVAWNQGCTLARRAADDFSCTHRLGNLNRCSGNLNRCVQQQIPILLVPATSRQEGRKGELLETFRDTFMHTS